jgi:glycosyltransferase involved in cell wall biosynthesis
LQLIEIMKSGKSSFEALEVSVIIPCLNEADTLENCLQKAKCALLKGGIVGEIIVADNGSTDGSVAIAQRMNVRIVSVPERGYGHALMAGITEADGRYIIMGDADDSYDFLEIALFVEKLRKGYDLVQGCRLPSGGGKIVAGAMPFLHRWIGNPMFSAMIRFMFKIPVHDVYCGLRGFTKKFYQSVNLRCTGMEFATEMVIKAGLLQAKVAEIPITLYPDGRKTHEPHLKTFRDGWRTLRFIFIYSPRWLFLIPGFFLIVFGIAGYGLVCLGVVIGRLHLDAHTLLFASLSIICGYQSVLFWIFTKTFAIGEGLLPEDLELNKLFQLIDLKKGLGISVTAMLSGGILLLLAINQWRINEFGRLDYAQTMRWVIPGVTLTALGFQTFLSSFFVSILGMRRR